MKEIGHIEKVLLVKGSRKKTVEAKIDTGAVKSSVDYRILKELGEFPIVGSKSFKSAISKGDVRPLMKITFFLAGEKIDTVVSAAKRMGLSCPMIVGKKDLEGRFVVNVAKKFTHPPK